MSSALSVSAQAAVVRALTALMEEISETGYCAGWMSGLEYDLWRYAQAGQACAYGQTWLDQEQIDALRELSTLIDGWITFEDGYVPMATWCGLFEARMAWA